MSTYPNTARRLYRSRTDHKLTGLSGGLAEYLNVDPSLVRVGWVAATLLTFPMAPIAYVIASLIIPHAPEYSDGPVAGDTLSI